MANKHSKVVWLEGMTLDPHHFQQWDRHHSDSLSTRIHSLNRHSWGLTGLLIDEQRLANGEFAVKSAAGIFPDGVVFSMPDRDPLPPARTVADVFEATASRLDAFLCLPSVRDHGINCQLQGAASSSLARHRARSWSAVDENTGADDRSIEVAELNFQIRFGTESLEGFSALQVASIVRSPSGVFESDETFIPTTLNISASTRIAALARRLLELAVAKSSSLSERRVASASQRQLTTADITVMGLLASLNHHIPLLKDAISGADSHPHDLYRRLLSLAGQLSAYVTDPIVHPRDLPVYDHGSQTGCFNDLADTLERMLGGARAAANYRQLPLRQTRENLYEVEFDEEELRAAELILFARSQQLPEGKLVSELPAMIRLASSKVIDHVLQSYTRALTVDHTSRLPAGVPEDPNASYFRIQRSGPFWDGICDSGVMAIFVPADFGDVELRVVAVLRSDGA